MKVFDLRKLISSSATDQRAYLLNLKGLNELYGRAFNTIVQSRATLYRWHHINVDCYLLSVLNHCLFTSSLAVFIAWHLMHNNCRLPSLSAPPRCSGTM